MYSVGELSKLTKVSIRTLHYYDEIGLLHPSSKSDTGYRYYRKDDLIKLQQIIALKRLGFKLSQIKGVMTSTPDESSRINRWKQIFQMELDSIQVEKQRLNHLEQCLHATIHSLEMTGNVEAEDILLIIQSIQREDENACLNSSFTDEEQAIIMEQLPDLTTDNEITKKWIEILSKVHRNVDEPVDSDGSQELAREIMQFISIDLAVEDALIDKYWEKIKPDQEHSEKVMGLDKKTMDYMERILFWYEKYGEGRSVHAEGEKE